MEDAIRITVVSEAEEVREIAALADTVWHECYGSLLSPNQITYMLGKFLSVEAISAGISRENYTYYVLSDDERMIGFCAVCPTGKELFLSKLYLLADYRGRKLARLVVQMLRERCLAEGLEAIWLTVNKQNDHAIAVYQRLGFEKVDEMVTDIGNGYVMDDYKLRLQVRGEHGREKEE